MVTFLIPLHDDAMGLRPRRFRGAGSALVGVVAVLASSGVLRAQESPPAVAPPASSAASATTIDDALFPRQLKSEAGTVVLHAPQIDTWAEYRNVTARAALEVTLGKEKPFLGTGHFTAATETDLETRVVTLYDVSAEQFTFPGAKQDRVERAAALIRELMAKEPQKVPLDLFLNYVADTAPPQQAGLEMAPPPIFMSETPAVLVVLNGEPVLSPIPDSSVEYALNTNWDLFKVKDVWYLRNGKRWLSTKNLDGAWEATTKLPAALDKLPDDANWRDVRASIPPTGSAGPPPKVIVSRQPAELIVTTGPPQLEPIGGSGIAYVTNTTSELFTAELRWFFLASGRWFTAPTLADAWSAAGTLPAAFADIPADHEKGYVLASVPGTVDAKRAVLEAEIPRTAVLDRTATAPVEVTYDGAPMFVPIEGTTLSRASNSMYDVVKYGDSYYLCYNAVWYASSAAEGPWAITDSVPPEVYIIPPSSPVHHVSHVKVYESTPGTVTTGYTGGYYGAYSTGVTVVFGTGYPYPPYYRYGGLYPVYFWHPYSYGYGSWYNPNSGAFGEAVVRYGPYGGAGYSAAYNPQTGTYRRGSAAWDEDELIGTARAYNPRTGTGVLTNRYATEDSAWGETAIMRGDEWAYAQSERQGNTTVTDIQTSRGGVGNVTTVREGDTTARSSELTQGDRSITSSGERTGNTFTGNFETGSGAAGTVNRTLNDDGSLSREIEATRDGQTGTISGTTTRDPDGGLQTEFETSGGAAGTIDRDVQNGNVQRSSEITRDGQTIQTDTVRGDAGTVGTIQSGGETIGVGRTESGDLYAAKDGEVYRRTDGGWEQNNGSGGWTPSSSQAGTTSAGSAGSRATQPTASSGSSQISQLDRDRTARESGFEQYNGFKQQGAAPRPTGARGAGAGQLGARPAPRRR